MTKMTDHSKKRGSTGEVYVWLTSLGLAIGVSMVVFLLGLVIYNGFGVFWPKNVAQVYLKSDKHAVLGGEINKIQKKMRGSEEKEYQFYVANKDVYGYSFKYVDEAAIDKIDFPKDVLFIERMEYGDTIGFPKEIALSDGSKVVFADASFESLMKRLIDQAADFRKQIKRVEKKEIGSINARMEQIRLKEKSGASSSALDTEKKVLQQRYQVLSEKSKFLRKAQNEASLTLTLLSGEEKKILFGQVVDVYYPNKLSFIQKVLRALKAFWIFVSDDPREANTEGGIFPAIFGTFVMTLLMSVAVTPFGVLAAIYLREYAKQGFLVRTVRIAVNNLAGVPSIVFGVFGLGFFVYFLGSGIDSLFFKNSLPTPTFGTGGILWAALTLALMTVPVVIVATEEALSAVSRGVREGSLACGASKWQTIQNVVLPASAPGILTGLILAMARGAGEVAPLMLVGVVKLAPSMPLDGVFPFFHLDRKFMHLGFHIYDLGFQSPDSEAAKPMVYATTFLLILLVVALNLTAIIIRNKLRKKYALSAF